MPNPSELARMSEELASISEQLHELEEFKPVEQPNLGLATTRQLLEELQARAEMHGYADYRTVDGD